MQLKWGSYAFGVNQTLLAVSQTTRINRGGQPYAQFYRIQVQGYLTGNGQAAITAAENTFDVAMSIPYQNLVFYQDSGSPSAEQFLNGQTITGMKVVEGPSYTTTYGPEYATLRTFNVTFEGEFPLNGTSNLLLDYTETLSFAGGLPLYVMREAINGPPQRQLIYPQMPYTCRQFGTSVGYRSYPVPNQPKFPGALKEGGKFDYTSPTRMGNGYQNYAVTWDYTFESVDPLVALPALWI